MSTSTATIDCAKCRIPLKGPSNAKPDDILTCERCGGRIKVKDAVEQAKKLFTEKVRKDLKDIFRKAGFK